MKAYSMGRFQRVVGTDGRFSGTWVVLIASGKHRASVRPHDVTVYDEARHSGRILGPCKRLCSPSSVTAAGTVAIADAYSTAAS